MTPPSPAPCGLAQESILLPTVEGRSCAAVTRATPLGRPAGFGLPAVDLSSRSQSPSAQSSCAPSGYRCALKTVISGYSCLHHNKQPRISLGTRARSPQYYHSRSQIPLRSHAFASMLTLGSTLFGSPDICSTHRSCSLRSR